MLSPIIDDEAVLHRRDYDPFAGLAANFQPADVVLVQHVKPPASL
jgi:hypothetical protein